MKSGLKGIDNQLLMVVVLWSHQNKKTEALFLGHITNLLLCTQHRKPGNKSSDLLSFMGKTLNQGFQAHKIALIVTAVLHSVMSCYFH